MQTLYKFIGMENRLFKSFFCLIKVYFRKGERLALTVKIVFTKIAHAPFTEKKIRLMYKVNEKNKQKKINDSRIRVLSPRSKF